MPQGAGFEGKVPGPTLPLTDGPVTALARRSCLGYLSVVRIEEVRGSGQGAGCSFPDRREEAEKSTTRGTG